MFSTVNVQHLESLNDQICELTGIRVRETVPDAVIGVADEVVLIDITPQSLIERLLAGKVYSGERIQSALNNFFKVENLSALREVALRQVAEEVEAKRLPVEPAVRAARRRAARSTAPPRRRSASGCSRSSSRSRSRSGSSVAPGARPSGSAPSSTCCGSPTTTPHTRSRSSSRRCASSPACSAAHLLIEHGEDVALVTQQVANDRGTTYVLMGTPKPRSAFRRMTSPALPYRLIALLPGVDLRIVADRSRRPKEEP